MKLFAFTAALALAAAAQAAVVGWNFSDGNAVADTGVPVANLTVGSIVTGNNSGTVATPISSGTPSDTYTGASGTNNLGIAANPGALSTTTSTYVSVTLTPASGYAVVLSDFDFGVRSSNTGATTYALRAGPSFSTNIATNTITVPGNNWQFKDNAFTSVQFADESAVELRVYFYNGPSNANPGTIVTRLDDIALNVSAIAVPEPTSLALLTLGGLTVLCRRRA